MSDAVLDDQGFLAARERFWAAALTDERYRENRAAVAERDGDLIGIAMLGRPWTLRRRGRGSCMCSMCMQLTMARVLGERWWRPSSTPRSRRRCGLPILTLARTRLPQAWLRCRRDGPGRGRRAGDSHGPPSRASSRPFHARHVRRPASPQEPSRRVTRREVSAEQSNAIVYARRSQTPAPVEHQKPRRHASRVLLSHASSTFSVVARSAKIPRGSPKWGQRLSRPPRPGRNAALQLFASRGNAGGMNLGRRVCATHRQRSATVLLASGAALLGRQSGITADAREPQPRERGSEARPLRNEGEPAFVEEQLCVPAFPIVVRSGHAPCREPRDRVMPRLRRV
jgi:hypothetical protein